MVVVNNRNSRSACFGGSRNISVTHKDDNDDLTTIIMSRPDSRQTTASRKLKTPRSIFDTCDVISYTGRFT